MMTLARKSGLGGLAAAIALGAAPGAWAQPAAPAPAAPPPTSEAPPVVVTGQRPVTHKCGGRDQVCIAAVIKQIWLEHPQEVREWCLKQDMRYSNETMMLHSLAGPGDVGPMDHAMPEAERQLCDYGRTHKAQ